MIIEAILGVIFLSFMRGKEDGKWGCFLLILVIFLIISFISEGG